MTGKNLSASQNLSKASRKHAYWTEANLRDDGIYDERNLLNFQTLHELQLHASIAFAENKLFGTYVKKEGTDETFEWMVRVNVCIMCVCSLGLFIYYIVRLITIHCLLPFSNSLSSHSGNTGRE